MTAKLASKIKCSILGFNFSEKDIDRFWQYFIQK